MLVRVGHCSGAGGVFSDDEIWFASSESLYRSNKKISSYSSRCTFWLRKQVLVSLLVDGRMVLRLCNSLETELPRTLKYMPFLQAANTCVSNSKGFILATNDVLQIAPIDSFEDRFIVITSEHHVHVCELQLGSLSLSILKSCQLESLWRTQHFDMKGNKFLLNNCLLWGFGQSTDTSLIAWSIITGQICVVIPLEYQSTTIRTYEDFVVVDVENGYLLYNVQSYCLNKPYYAGWNLLNKTQEFKDGDLGVVHMAREDPLFKLNLLQANRLGIARCTRSWMGSKLCSICDDNRGIMPFDVAQHVHHDSVEFEFHDCILRENILVVVLRHHNTSTYKLISWSIKERVESNFIVEGGPCNIVLVSHRNQWYIQHRNYLCQLYTECKTPEIFAKASCWSKSMEEIRNICVLNAWNQLIGQVDLLVLEELLELYDPIRVKAIILHLIQTESTLRFSCCKLLVGFIKRMWRSFEGSREFSSLTTSVKKLCMSVIRSEMHDGSNDSILQVTQWLNELQCIAIYTNHRCDRVFSSASSKPSIATPITFFDWTEKQWKTSFTRPAFTAPKTLPPNTPVRTAVKTDQDIIKTALISGNVSCGLYEMPQKPGYEFSKQLTFLDYAAGLPTWPEYAYFMGTCRRFIFKLLSNDSVDFSFFSAKMLRNIGENVSAFIELSAFHTGKRSVRWRLMEHIRNTSGVSDSHICWTDTLTLLERIYPSSSISVTKRRFKTLVLSGRFPDWNPPPVEEITQVSEFEKAKRLRQIYPQSIRGYSTTTPPVLARQFQDILQTRMSNTRESSKRFATGIGIGFELEVPILSRFTPTLHSYEGDHMSSILGRKQTDRSSIFKHAFGDLDDIGLRKYEDVPNKFPLVDGIKLENEYSEDNKTASLGGDAQWGKPFWKAGEQLPRDYYEGYLQLTLDVVKRWSYETRERVLLEARFKLNNRDLLVGLKYAVERCERHLVVRFVEMLPVRCRHVDPLNNSPVVRCREEDFRWTGIASSATQEDIVVAEAMWLLREDLQNRTPTFFFKFVQSEFGKRGLFVANHKSVENYSTRNNIVEAMFQDESDFKMPFNLPLRMNNTSFIKMLPVLCEGFHLFIEKQNELLCKLLPFGEYSPFHLAYIHHCVENTLLHPLTIYMDHYQLGSTRDSLFCLNQYCPISETPGVAWVLLLRTKSSTFDAAIHHCRVLYPDCESNHELLCNLNAELAACILSFGSCHSWNDILSNRLDFINHEPGDSIFDPVQLVLEHDIDVAFASNLQTVLENPFEFQVDVEVDINRIEISRCMSISDLSASKIYTEGYGIEYYLSKGLGTVALYVALELKENESGFTNKQVGNIARRVTLEHFRDPLVLIACCWILKILELPADTLSIDCAAANLISSQQPSMTEVDVAHLFLSIGKRTFQVDEGLIAVLQKLGDAASSAGSSNADLKLVGQFCSAHNLPQSYALLHELSRSNDFLGFLYEAQTSGIHPDIAATVVRDSFSDPITREHLLLVINQAKCQHTLSIPVETPFESVLLFNSFDELLDFGATQCSPHYAVLATSFLDSDVKTCFIAWLKSLHPIFKQGDDLKPMLELGLRHDLYSELITGSYVFLGAHCPLGFYLLFRRAAWRCQFRMAYKYLGKLCMDDEWQQFILDGFVELFNSAIENTCQNSQHQLLQLVFVLQHIEGPLGTRFTVVFKFICLMQHQAGIPVTKHLLEQIPMETMKLLLSYGHFDHARSFLALLESPLVKDLLNHPLFHLEMFSISKTLLEELFHTTTICQAHYLLMKGASEPYNDNRMTKCWNKCNTLFQSFETPHEMVVNFYVEVLDSLYGNFISPREVACILNKLKEWVDDRYIEMEVTRVKKPYLGFQSSWCESLTCCRTQLHLAIDCWLLLVQSLAGSFYINDLPRLSSYMPENLQHRVLYENLTFDFLQDEQRLDPSKVAGCSRFSAQVMHVVDVLINNGRLSAADVFCNLFQVFVSGTHVVVARAVLELGRCDNRKETIAKFPRHILVSMASPEILETCTSMNLFGQFLAAFPSLKGFIEKVRLTWRIGILLGIGYDQVSAGPLETCRLILENIPFGSHEYSERYKVSVELVMDIVRCFEVDLSALREMIVEMLLNCSAVHESDIFIACEITGQSADLLAAVALDHHRNENSCSYLIVAYLSYLQALNIVGVDMVVKEILNYIPEIMKQQRWDLAIRLLVETEAYVSLCCIFENLLLFDKFSVLIQATLSMNPDRRQLELKLAIEDFVCNQSKLETHRTVRILTQLSLFHSIGYILYQRGKEMLVLSGLEIKSRKITQNLLIAKQLFQTATVQFLKVSAGPDYFGHGVHMAERARLHDRLIGVQLELLNQDESQSVHIVIGLSPLEAAKLASNLSVEMFDVIRRVYLIF